MDPQMLLQLIGSLLAQGNAMSKKPKDATTQANNQATFLSKLASMASDPTLLALMGQAPSAQSQPISTPLVDSYMNGKNETLRMAVQGIVSGEYSPQDAVALIMGDQTLSSYYNPASGGDISYWNSQMKSVMDELSQAQEASAKAASEDPYGKMGLADPSLRYGTSTDQQTGMVQVPADTSYYDNIIARDGLSGGQVESGLQGPTTGSGLQGPTSGNGFDPLGYLPKNLDAVAASVASGPKVKQQALQFGGPQGAGMTQIVSPATWDSNSVAAARQLFLGKQAAQANASGRTPFSDSAGQLTASLMKMFGLG